MAEKPAPLMRALSKEWGLGGIGQWILDGVNDPTERWQVLREAGRCSRSRSWE